MFGFTFPFIFVHDVSNVKLSGIVMKWTTELKHLKMVVGNMTQNRSNANPNIYVIFKESYILVIWYVMFFKGCSFNE